MVQDETQTKTQCYEYFVYFFSYFISFTLKSRTNVILINIIVCKSFKKNVDCNICQVKTRGKYSRSLYDGKSSEMASST